MNQFRLLYIFTFVLILFSCKEEPQNRKKSEIITKVSNKIEILDFHTAHRCKACISIEANTKLTIEKYFDDDLESGKLSFRLINADAKENEQIVEEYGAYGTSLFINAIKDGKEKHIDLTNFAFKTEANKEKFMSELKLKIEAELKNI
jgi:hypothetical protein